MSETGGATASASVEVLRKLKEIENDWDAKLVAARAETAARLTKSREAAEAAIAAARVDAERWREVQLVAARIQAQTEADSILAAGRRTASDIESAVGKGMKVAGPKVLDAILGEFRSSDSGGK